MLPNFAVLSARPHIKMQPTRRMDLEDQLFLLHK